MGLFSRKAITDRITRKQIGDHYEALAKRYLSRQGLSYITANFTTKFGEIDLIMKHHQTIVFVEVKYRKQSHYGHAAEMVTPQKMRKLYKTANVWLIKQGLSVHTTDFRFDVIAIQGEENNIDWIQNAITQG
ncbi:YraN family protein [Vibrio gallaecicus]|uniref:YraN family protein n=1 Tax=Vibrio gallaecicus TaxID=552386 RepID=UPI0010C9AE52|nr:YraN family protein [Vibrio gallaecicus]MDN3614061.1 YraN family protein [Vibrio gallaecicus]